MGEGLMPGSESKPTARVAVTKKDDLSDVSVGETISFEVTGTVVAVRGPDEYMDEIWKDGKPTGKSEKRTHPGSLEVEIGKLILNTNEFDRTLGED